MKRATLMIAGEKLWDQMHRIMVHGRQGDAMLAISAIDDRFDTAVRAQAIAKTVSNGRSVIYASGGHALVGRQAEAIGEVTAFLRGM